MAFRKFVPLKDAPSVAMKPLNFSIKIHDNSRFVDSGAGLATEPDVDVDLREVYFLIMHFLSSGPCQRTCGQFWNELLEHQLLPRRYHAWYSRSGVHSGDENDDGMSLPLTYSMLAERYSYAEKDHLVKLLKQLIISRAHPSRSISGGNAPNAADVPTLIGTGSFSLLSYDRDKVNNVTRHPPTYMRWPHVKADQVRGLCLREIGGGFARHQRAPSIRASCYAIAKPSTMFQKMQNVKKIRGHRNAVYCATIDRSGRYVITGSDDRLVKFWSMEAAYCLASCRGHEGDITDLAVSSNNAVVASSSNDCIIRVWRLPDGQPISVLRGHTGAVTAIEFSPRPGYVYQLLSSSDDGTCRIWDARNSQLKPRVYVPRPSDGIAGRNNGPSSSTGVQNHQIFCCAFNSSGTVFVTGSSDTLARVWSASKPNSDDSDQPNYEIDVLAGHENDVNYVQFSGCAIASRFMTADTVKEENVPKFRNSWFTHDNIVTCSRDGSAIIWTPRSRRSSAKACRWTRAYHLKVPPPPMPPQPVRGGPRQRILPTPRGVNMIIWSLDNRFVLAAIMDCRICVWNASDGSLVHSLTGHTESTYVLDVHPFNPRIAMSAGYDGKIIVWDIWEGKPIRTHEISHFKLVDGKFSPDGTSIIMSDDVGQLYIVNTGQGESQQDAKYDQFYLGDYRPLIQDTHGNVLDQETQLPTYRRNMQDLLCDSSMIPYPEPYQSEYQKRRLGAMGVEWKPSSLRLATGPDFTLDPEFQMLLPLADLDILTEPLPEFPDMMEWEPEIEIHSDDNDSEYNVPEEYLSGGDQGGVCSSSTVDSESSEEDDGGTEEGQLDSIRRSKRKKKKSKIEVKTSSGRRVKRRNMDGADGSSIRKNRPKKLKSGRRASRKKLSKSKLRPQRAAALNALNLFSKITGTSTDGEDDDDDENGDDNDADGSEIETSESGSAIGDSNIDSDGSEKSLQHEQQRRSKGKEISFDESVEDLKGKAPELPVYPGSRARLVLKLPSKYSVRDREMSQRHKLDDSAGPSSEISRENGIFLSSRAGDRVEELSLAESPNIENMKWGGIKARTTKRRRVGEATSVSTDCRLDKDDNVEAQKYEAFINSVTLCAKVNGTVQSSSLEHEVPDKTSKSSNKDIENPANFLSEKADATNHMSTESTLNGTSEEPETCERETRSLVGNSENGGCKSLSEIGLSTEQEPTVPKDGNGGTVYKLDSNIRDFASVKSDIGRDENASALKDSAEPDLRSKKMFVAVYRRTKSHKGASKLVGSPSNTSNGNPSVRVESREGSVDELPRTPSPELRTSMGSPGPVADDVKLAQGPEPSALSGYKLRNTPNSSWSRNQPSNEEWGSSSSRATVGLRSTRSRRSNNYAREMCPIEARRPNKPSRKGWLMSATHEEGSRYIPQLGDEVAYLRQGHQEYLEHNRRREPTPWTSLKGNVKDVEFCRVEKLDYSPLPGSGESCCKMTLVFVDPASSVYHQSFRVTLPEMTGFPDFLVERTHYDASMQRNWTHRDKCRVWWKNDGEEDGGWWNGRILAVKPKSMDFPDSPWERYTVQYSSDPTETHLHSPWELFDIAASWEHPHIDDDSKANIQSVFAKLEKSSKPPQDRYGIIKLRQLSQRTNYNNSFPVPVSLDLIECRLENDYYRSLEAVNHDFETMVSNALQHLGNKVEFSGKLKRLTEWLTKTFSAFL